MHDTDLHPAHWLHTLTPRQWLTVGVVSFVLVIVSCVVLFSRLEKAPGNYALQWYDQAERFSLETIRLSFGNRSLVLKKESVFIAPIGILDEKAVFNWLAADLTFETKVENQITEAVAPARILDPDWQPTFTTDINSRKSP